MRTLTNGRHLIATTLLTFTIVMCARETAYADPTTPLRFAAISLADAQRLALAHSPDVEVARASVDASAASLAQARGTNGLSALVGYTELPQGSGLPNDTWSQRLAFYELQATLGDVNALSPLVAQASAALRGAVMDELVTERAERLGGYTAIAEALRERVILLESALLGDPRRTDAILLAIYEMKKNLTTFRQAVVPMRDILNPILRGDLQLFEQTELAYFRDVHDHVNRVVDQLDGARELINNARDTHISLATNRQNEVTKQLTIVATIFLPLSFITGFFGQNFSWLVNNLNGFGTFAVWGIGGEVVAVVALVAYFRFKHWF